MRAQFKEEINVSTFMGNLTISNEQEYEERLKYVEHLMDRANGGEEAILPLLRFVSGLIEEYEDRVYPLENSTPGRMVAFFMEQHGHKQKDLSDIAPQSVISEIINGRRVPTTEQVKKLSLKYHTNPAVFL